MYRSALTGALALSLLMPIQAQACRITRRVQPADALYADLVVVGRITNYRLSSDQQEAHFEVAVDEVLAGELPKNLEVSWNPHNFAVPDAMRPGPFLIGLVDQSSTKTWHGQPDAPLLVATRGGGWMVFQGFCSEEFILEPTGETAVAMRALLSEDK